MSTALARRHDSDRFDEVVDPRTFRNALGCFATGVAIVTASTEDGERLGMTVNSFSSVSLDPPLVLFSIAKSSLSIQQWLSVREFAVCILGETQRETSNRFAKAGGDKWAPTACRPAATIGAPLVANSLASFECVRHECFDGGDHIILLGRVQAVRMAASSQAKGLVFYRGRYAGLHVEADGGTPDVNSAFMGW